MQIKTLFSGDIYRRIEEVIKVDQRDEAVIVEEIQEYVFTQALRRHFAEVLERYHETLNKPHEGIAVWVSGFFGSGKSSFAKLLGLAIENQTIQGEAAGARIAMHTGDQLIQVLLTQIHEKIPTHTVIFDVSTDRGIRSGNQNLTELMYRLFLKSLGYPQDLDLAELEITLEEEGHLDAFKQNYQELFPSKNWDQEKGKIALAMSQASRVMHSLDPATYPQADSWVKAARERADVNPNLLAERCLKLMEIRAPHQQLLFVIDEVGQFVARDVQKMLDLQGAIQALGRAGRGKIWVVATSQEQLKDLVGGLDDRRVELARLRDRFSTQIHLEPSDISEVTSRRLLTKQAQAQKQLRELFEAHRGRLTEHTRLSAEVRLPELTAESFIDLYPLLPYQIDLIIQIVSGLRTQGTASKHSGGANRTIIKLAQQLLINPSTELAEKPVGTLVTLDQLYDLVEGDIDSDIRMKIAAIPQELEHPLAQAVARVICLLQHVPHIHRSEANIAALLHKKVDADSCLAEVKQALNALVKAHKIRLGEDGYRIPTPVEDDWEIQRSRHIPKTGELRRTYTRYLKELWKPIPVHNFLEVRAFRAGLNIEGQMIEVEDLLVHLNLCSAADRQTVQEEARTRSQTERQHLFWVMEIQPELVRAAEETFRSEEMLSTRERNAQGRSETQLVAEERRRLNRNQDELKRLLKMAFLSGSVYFRGQDRSPGESQGEIHKVVGQLMQKTLPEVYERFAEAAATVSKKDLEALLSSENLRGLPTVFNQLKLLREEQGKPLFQTDSGPLSEIMTRIEHQSSYGKEATGHWLSEEMKKEPFGWDFEIVRLFVLSLLRAGKIQVISKSQFIESALSSEARETFSNNNFFKAAMFQPKKGLDFEALLQASSAFEQTFGGELSELEQGPVAQRLRQAAEDKEPLLDKMARVLLEHKLPGREILEKALEHLKSLRQGSEAQIIQLFNHCHSSLREAFLRAAELDQNLTADRLNHIQAARNSLKKEWPFLEQEGPSEALQKAAEELRDILQRETFFKEFVALHKHTQSLSEAYQGAYAQALEACSQVYSQACRQIMAFSEWQKLTEQQQERLISPLQQWTQGLSEDVDIRHLRAQTQACEAQLKQAIAQMFQFLESDKLVKIEMQGFFKSSIETENELDHALQALRETCLRHIIAGKKILIQ
jgi:hypothetical protein